MTDTSWLQISALKVGLVLDGLKFQGDISKSTQVIPDFFRLKGKMILAAIETVVSFLEQKHRETKGGFYHRSGWCSQMGG